jgi:hypothetical protein
MGCTSSKEKEQAAAAAAEKQRKREAATAALNAPKVDPKDFMACKLKGQTIVKEPGSAHHTRICKHGTATKRLRRPRVSCT